MQGEEHRGAAPSFSPSRCGVGDWLQDVARAHSEHMVGLDSKQPAELSLSTVTVLHFP